MTKTEAFKLLGVTTVTAVAELLGITHSAVSQWPDDDKGQLSESAENRVLAYLARKHLPPEKLQAGEAV